MKNIFRNANNAHNGKYDDLDDKKFEAIVRGYCTPCQACLIAAYKSDKRGRKPSYYRSRISNKSPTSQSKYSHSFNRKFASSL